MSFYCSVQSFPVLSFEFSLSILHSGLHVAFTCAILNPMKQLICSLSETPAPLGTVSLGLHGSLTLSNVNRSGLHDLSCSTKCHMTLFSYHPVIARKWCGLIMSSVGHTISDV
jgi:hypothetical protein